MGFLRGGAAAEQILKPITDIPPTSVVGVADGPAMGPMEPVGENPSRLVRVWPSGTFTNLTGVDGVSPAESDGQTVRIRAFERVKVLPTGRQVKAATKGLSGADQKAARLRLIRDYVDTKRFGVNLRNVDDSDGDDIGDWRKMNQDFSRWDDPLELATLVPDGTLCGVPVLLEPAVGLAYLFALVLMGDGHLYVKVWRFSLDIRGVGDNASAYPWWQEGTPGLRSMFSMFNLPESAAAQLSGTVTPDGKMLLAVSNSAGSIPTVTNCRVGIMRYEDPFITGIPAHPTDNPLVDDTMTATANLDLRKQFGGSIQLHESGKPCGLSIEAGRNSIGLAVSCVTRGHYSDSATNHLTVLYSRSVDGITWGFGGKQDAETVRFRAAHNIEALVDIPTLAKSSSPGFAPPDDAPPIVAGVRYATSSAYTASADGEVYETATAGRTWIADGATKRLRSNNATLAINGLHCTADGTSIVAVCDRGTVILSTTGGRTWKLVCTADDFLRNNAQPTDFAAGVTKDTAKSLANVTLRDVVLFSATEWVIFGDKANVWYTVDSGVHIGRRRSESAASYRAGAIKDGVSKGVIVVGSPDPTNENKRIAYTNDITVTTPTWVVLDVDNPQGEQLNALTKKSGGSAHGQFGWLPVATASTTTALDAAISRPAGTTTLHMDGFAVAAAPGDEFTIAGDDQVYIVTSATPLVAGDSDVSFQPPLVVAIPAADGNEVVTFRGSGFIAGAHGIMIRLDSSIATTPEEVLDEDLNRFTGADLYGMALIAGVRFVVGDEGEVLRTSLVAGAPMFAEQLIDNPRSLRTVAADALNTVLFGGLEGWAVLNATTSNRCYGKLKYLWSTGEWLMSVSNTNQGEVEILRSEDDGEHYAPISLRDAGTVIRFAPSGSPNTITADDGTLGTPRTNFIETIEGILFLVTGNSPTTGQWGIGSLDGGITWKDRLSTELAMPLGYQRPAIDPLTWHFNATREVMTFNDGLLISAAYDSTRAEILVSMAREWSDTGSILPPIVTGRRQYVGDRNILANPKVTFEAVPESGDEWVSYPFYDYGTQNLSIESPSKIWRKSNFIPAGADSGDDIANAELIWDRNSAPDRGDHWDVDSMFAIGSNVPYLIWDLTIPSYSGSSFPTDPTKIVRFITSAEWDTYDIAEVIGKNVIRCTKSGVSPNWVEDQFSPGMATFYVLIHDGAGASLKAHKVLRSGPDALLLDCDTSSGFSGKKAMLYMDRHISLGASPRLMSDLSTEIATSLKASTYRFAKFLRLSVPYSGSTEPSATAPQKIANFGRAQLGTVRWCNQTSLAAPPSAPANEPHRPYGLGASGGPITNVLSEETQAGTDVVTHFGDPRQVWNVLYPAMWWSQRDQLMNMMVRNGLTRQAVGLVLDSANPLRSLHIARLTRDPSYAHLFKEYFSLDAQFREVA